MAKIHIGKKIKEVLDSTHFTVVEFAKRINLTRGGANNIFKKETIAADQLQKISEVLGHDFFTYYSNNLSIIKEYKNPYGFATKTELENLKQDLLKEFEKLRQDLDLKKAPGKKKYNIKKKK